jgi:chaperone modulatory protein CbpM
MMRLTAVVARYTDLDEAELTAWVERGWIQVEEDNGAPALRDLEVARVHLIHDLRTSMRIDDETIPLILSLLDQVYELRDGLRAVLRAVDSQPAWVRNAIFDAIE